MPRVLARTSLPRAGGDVMRVRVRAIPASRRRRAACTACAVLSIVGATAIGAPITLQQALALAEQRNPSLQAARASAAAAEGEWRDARAPLWNNPEVATDIRRRRLQQAGEPDAQRYDAGIALSQKFELGGQQSARRKAADAGQDAVRQTIENTRREIRADTAQRFVRVLVLQQRALVEQQSLDLVQRAAEFVRRRVSAGEDSRLDGNLALVEAERASNQLAQVHEQLAEARAVLATVLQWTETSPPEAIGNLEVSMMAYSLDELLAVAARHPKLQALESKELAARSRLDVERGSVYPDLTVGLGYSVEKAIGGEDRIATLGFSLPLPLFRRNAAGIGRALTELDQARIERQAAERDTVATVTALWQRLQSLRQRVDRLQTGVLPSLEENQKLSLKALQAGEIGVSQFLLVRRQVFDGQRDLLDARIELETARIALETAAGWPMELPALDANATKDNLP